MNVKANNAIVGLVAYYSEEITELTREVQRLGAENSMLRGALEKERAAAQVERSKRVAASREVTSRKAGGRKVRSLLRDEQPTSEDRDDG